MPSAVSPDPQPPTADELDALFNYDAGLEEMARGGNVQDHSIAPTTENAYASNTLDAFVSNADEEVIVTRKRKPVAKLDEARLLSSSGIPRLRSIAKNQRFKGKGHELSDMASLLHMYQLWLDDMYPRAKFADGLAIIEKLGHKKTMQMHRKGWIDEGKPRQVDDSGDERIGDVADPEPTGDDDADQQPPPVSPPSVGQPDEEAPRGMERETIPPVQQPDEDELDALMAEAQNEDATRPQGKEAEMFLDEEEAMAGMEW